MLDERRALIKRLRDAKKAHRKWVSDAQILIEGVPVKNDQLPLNETECKFGSWYYGEGQALKQFPVFKRIEKPHTRLHRVYLQIFKILFQERKVSLWGRLMGKKAEPSEEELQEAQRLFRTLNTESEKIMELLDELEKVISELSEEEFQKIYRASSL